MADIVHYLPEWRFEDSFDALTERELDYWHRQFKVPEAWKKSKGEGVKIAILDTGVDKSHLETGDLKGQVLDAKDFTGSRYGYFDRSSGHGVHCAGVIGAREDDTGVMGLCYELRKKGGGLLIGKVLGDNGSGRGSWIANGIRWAVSKGAKIISMSLGSPVQDTQITNAIREAVRAGVVVICAAGNDGRDNSVNWPAKMDEVIAVAAVDQNFKLAPFSSRGPEVDIAGPGVNVLSCGLDGTWVRMSGTCIAAGDYVYGPQGPCKIERVKAGDVIFAFKDGKLVERAVQAAWYRGENNTHRLIAGGRDVRLTETHQVMTINSRTRELEWVRFSELTQHHRLLLPRKMRTQVNPYLDATISKDLCWLLGFFASDGWVCETTHGLRTCFATGVKPDVEREVARIYEASFGKSLRFAKNGRWTYDDSTMIATLILSLCPNTGAATKTVPLWVWNMPLDKQTAFYNGYTTADGHRYSHPQYKSTPDSFETVSGDLIRRLACLADYWGLRHSAVASRTRLNKAPNSKTSKWMTSHTLKIHKRTGNTSLPVGGWSFLKRNGRARGIDVARAMGVDTDAFSACAWRSVEHEKTAVYDLTVPDADCFVTQGIVVHNSMSTPFAAGVAGLLVATAPSLPWSPEAVRQTIINNADNAGSPGHDTGYGAGLIRPDRIVESATPPDNGNGNGGDNGCGLCPLGPIRSDFSVGPARLRLTTYDGEFAVIVTGAR